MKKKVRSKAALDKIAGNKKAIAPKAEKKALMPKKATPPAENKTVKAIEKVGKAQIMMMAELIKEVRQMKSETPALPEPVTEWDIDVVERDGNGSIKRIKAVAPRRVIN